MKPPSRIRRVGWATTPPVARIAKVSTVGAKRTQCLSQNHPPGRHRSMGAPSTEGGFHALTRAPGLSRATPSLDKPLQRIHSRDTLMTVLITREGLAPAQPLPDPVGR